MSVIGSLSVLLGFNVDDKKLVGFDKGVKDLRNSFATMALESVGAIYAVDKFSQGLRTSLQTSNDLRNAQRTYNLDIHKLQIWQITDAMDGMNMKTEETTSTILNFAKALKQADQYGQPQQWQLKLGVAGMQDPLAAMEVIRQRLKDPAFRDDATKSFWLEQAGFNPNMITNFKRTWQEQEDRANSVPGSVMSDAEIAKVNQANDALAVTTQEFNNLYRTITADVIPGILWFNKELINFTRGLHFLLSPPNKTDKEYPQIVQGKKHFDEDAGYNKPEKDRTLYNKIYAGVYDNKVTRAMTNAGEWIDEKLDDAGLTPHDNDNAADKGLKNVILGSFPGAGNAKLIDRGPPVQSPQPTDSGWKSLNALPIDGPQQVIPIMPDKGVDQNEFMNDVKKIQEMKNTGQQQSNNTNSTKIDIHVDGSLNPQQTADAIGDHLERLSALGQFNNSGVA